MDEHLRQTMDLIEDAKRGDRTAMNELCSRYLGRIHRIVRFRMGHRLRSKMDSMDIVQSVMIKVVDDIGQFDTGSESKFVNWLATIVEHTLRDKVDYFSAQKRDAAIEVPIIGKDEDGGLYYHDIPDHISPTTTQKIDAMEKIRMLEEALDELGEKQREIVILRNYAGMTFEEIANEIGSTKDAVRMLFVRTMDRLTDILVKKFKL